MESPGSFIRSAARATFSAYRRLPVRWRLGGGSAALTFVILFVFAFVIGTLTTSKISQQFVRNFPLAADYLAAKLKVGVDSASGLPSCTGVNLADFTSAEDAQVRVFDHAGRIVCTQSAPKLTAAASDATEPVFTKPKSSNPYTANGYRIEARRIKVGHQNGWVIYALPVSSLENTIDSLRLRLAISVLGGAVLALLAGLFVAQRAMRPVSELTDAAREIERTRDPSRRIPHPEADDEVAELARTLERMLAALDDARNESEAALERQREFVADASHELRTPLTSVLANLELLADELDGEQADSAKSALRATRRMRRLVGDLLLLARADAERYQPRRRTDLAQTLTDVAAELGPMAEARDLTVSASEAVVNGIADDLHRMILNVIENAVHHTPIGTSIRAISETRDGTPILIIEDNGPGIPPKLRQRVFERFFRGGGDAGDGPRGTGLGLAIVRAVADSHGATVKLSSVPEFKGTRFEIAFPPYPEDSDTDETSGGAGDRSGQTSTTTGSTIGRRRSLS